MLIFADQHARCSLHPELSSVLPRAEILGHQSVRGKVHELLESYAAEATGSSKRVTRTMLLEEPRSLDAREITEKGSLNQHEVLIHRAAPVERLYSSESSPLILRLTEK